jgi:signal transduction histidine kinase
MKSADATNRSEIDDLRAEVQMLRQQLMQAQKLVSIGALSSSMTHEFNNILTTVINYAKMGLRHKLPADRDKAFEKILAAGHRASRMTTGMLAFARAKGDHREPTSLARIVEDVLVLVEKDLQMHRIRLETKFDQEAWSEINVGQVQQVILNLIVNARQAMANGGNLTVTVRRNLEDGLAEVVVRDTGSGIPADKLPQLFQPFFTTKKPDEHGQGGTGLGLSLCKQVVDGHRGRIRVESTPGQGTAFSIRLPLVPAPIVHQAALARAK